MADKEVKVLRRRKVREMCNLLRSDLYERVPDPMREPILAQAVWESPLKNRCIYGYDETAEQQPVWCKLTDSRGKVYAETDDADSYWLGAEML